MTITLIIYLNYLPHTILTSHCLKLHVDHLNWYQSRMVVDINDSEAFLFHVRYLVLTFTGRIIKQNAIAILSHRSGSGRCWLAITAKARASRRKRTRTSTWAVVSPGGSTPRPWWPAPSCWSAPSAVGPTSATPWRTPGSRVSAHRQVHPAYS